MPNEPPRLRRVAVRFEGIILPCDTENSCRQVGMTIGEESGALIQEFVYDRYRTSIASSPPAVAHLCGSKHRLDPAPACPTADPICQPLLQSNVSQSLLSQSRGNSFVMWLTSNLCHS